MNLINDARVRIDVLVFSGTFFAQVNPRVAHMLREAATAGTKVRLCFGDPASDAVAVRGAEEGLGDSLAAKIRASLTYYRDLVGLENCALRLHGTTLYASIFRFDSTLLFNPHLWGQPASANPILHVRRTKEDGLFQRYEEGFEAVWRSARPWATQEKD
jgi:hypothetical protein